MKLPDDCTKATCGSFSPHRFAEHSYCSLHHMQTSWAWMFEKLQEWERLGGAHEMPALLLLNNYQSANLLWYLNQNGRHNTHEDVIAREVAGKLLQLPWPHYVVNCNTGDWAGEVPRLLVRAMEAAGHHATANVPYDPSETPWYLPKQKGELP